MYREERRRYQHELRRHHQHPAVYQIPNVEMVDGEVRVVTVVEDEGANRELIGEAREGGEGGDGEAVIEVL